MAVRLPSYLHRNRCGVFGFRLVVPADLRVAFSFHERRFTLGTRASQVALRLAYSLGLQVQGAFSFIRAMTDEEAKRSAAEAFMQQMADERDRMADDRAEEGVLSSCSLSVG